MHVPGTFSVWEKKHATDLDEEFGDLEQLGEAGGVQGVVDTYPSRHQNLGYNLFQLLQPPPPPHTGQIRSQSKQYKQKWSNKKTTNQRKKNVERQYLLCKHLKNCFSTSEHKIPKISWVEELLATNFNLHFSEDEDIHLLNFEKLIETIFELK